MAVITGDLYQSFTKPESSGGRLVPMAYGKMHVGVFGSDPTLKDDLGNYTNHIPIYYLDGLTGAKVAISNPVSLNSAGKPEFQGKAIQVETDDELYSIAIMNSSNQVPPGYANYRSGTKQAFDELKAACQEFGLPYSESGKKVMPLIQGMDLTGVIGLIASDGTLWYNNGISGIVTSINLDSGNFLGSIDVDSVSQALIKKRDENRYQPFYNYQVGDIVIGSDNKSYYAKEINGPSSGGAVNPVNDDSGKWTRYPYFEESDSVGLVYRKFYDGRCEVRGFPGKVSGTGSQLFTFKFPLSLVESVSCEGLFSNATVIARIYEYNTSSFRVSTYSLVDGSESTESGLVSIDINGRWY